MIINSLFRVPVFFVILTVCSCNSYFIPIKTDKAKLGARTGTGYELSKLPVPREPLVAAVYKFRDQTGQYKQMESSSSFSTAITQGATSILLKALEDSGWFIVIEREGLSNLLNERKIIRSSRLEYEGKQDQGGNNLVIPPLLFAGIILEGGIISYDTNILTGGTGLQYFGVGGSGEYREDRISICLRAISTQNGRILKTVYTTKSILSQMAGLNLYRFVRVKHLLEAETGYSFNEPIEIAVTEAIEKAVQSLIIEGVIDGLWALKDSTAINSKVIKEYLTEKSESRNADVFNHAQEPEKRLGVGASIGVRLYSGDYSAAKYRTAWGIDLRYSFLKGLALELNYRRGELASQRYFHKMFNMFSLNLLYQPGNLRFRPYLMLGTALMNETKCKEFIGENDVLLPVISSGAGAECVLTRYFSLSAAMYIHYLLNDKLDGIKHGDYNDYFWELKAGVIFYILK